VILYADQVTGSMARAIEETGRRREKQLAYNAEHGITPIGITKSIDDILLATSVADAHGPEESPGDAITRALEGADTDEMLKVLTREMQQAAAALEYERAASIRDTIRELLAGGPPAPEAAKPRPGKA
jgi:excinuclease ABC subunit B